MKRLVLTALAGAALLSGCATPTPYQPLGAPTGVRGGFTDQQIERNRFRVTFAGNQFTSRQRVENYLLYRAAERPLSKQILAMLQGHIQRMSFMQLSLAGFNRSSNEDHRAIVAALRQGDPEAAARAVAAHVNGVKDIVLELYERHHARH